MTAHPPAAGTEGTVAADLADLLVTEGIDRVFTVPGESFLPLLDALHERGVQVVTCRHENGAAFMAQAAGRLTGRPGVCLVSRAPGATNAAIGVHEAEQAGTPMLMIVGQASTGLLGRHAFQEVDLVRVFAPMAKAAYQPVAAAEVAGAARDAWRAAVSGRPGPAVLAVPTDLLRASTGARPATVASGDSPRAGRAEAVAELVAGAHRPMVIVGGGRWSAEAAADLRRWAEAWSLPIAVEFRCQDYLDNRSTSYVGDLGLAPSPALARRIADADVCVVIGGELGDIATQGFSLFARRQPESLLQVVDDPSRVRGRHPGRVREGGGPETVRALAQLPAPPGASAWQGRTGTAREEWVEWTSAHESGDELAVAVRGMSELASEHTVVSVGAGNYTGWVQRHWTFRQYGTQLAPRSGSMGYGLPSAVAAALGGAQGPVVSFGGDGCFLMTAQELATAARYGAGVVAVVVNNGMYGTIRMHQEDAYPGRVAGTMLTNPDFMELGRAYDCWTHRAHRAEEVLEAFADCVAHPERRSLIEIVTAPDRITPTRSLLRGGGLSPA